MYVTLDRAQNHGYTLSMLIAVYGEHECPYCGFVGRHVGQFREDPNGKILLGDTPVSPAWECTKCLRWWFNTLEPIGYEEGEWSA
jgi:hypothetical protein